MKTNSVINYCILIGLTLSVISIISSCKKEEVYYTKGVFPDSTLSMPNINTEYDEIAEDFTVDENDLDGIASLLISTNKNIPGGKYDIAQTKVSFSFGHKTGVFSIDGNTSSDSFLKKVLQKANSDNNELGPFRLFSSIDGYEYFIYSSTNANGNLDFYYLRNQPDFGTQLPEVYGPYPAQLLNTSADEDYICFDLNMDTCYYSSGPVGNQDIFVKSKSLLVDISTWLSGTYTISSKPDSLNSPADDRSPRIFKNYMIFSSNRPGGLGGYDLYYSVFKKGKWSLPINMGPEINTLADEVRPLIGKHSDYKNYFLVFSSNREGGKGGFDVYFKGFEIL